MKFKYVILAGVMFATPIVSVAESIQRTEPKKKTWEQAFVETHPAIDAATVNGAVDGLISDAKKWRDHKNAKARFQKALEAGDIRAAKAEMEKSKLSASDADFARLLSKKHRATGFQGARFLVENGLNPKVLTGTLETAARGCDPDTVFQALVLIRASGGVVDEARQDLRTKNALDKNLGAVPYSAWTSLRKKSQKCGDASNLLKTDGLGILTPKELGVDAGPSAHAAYEKLFPSPYVSKLKDVRNIDFEYKAWPSKTPEVTAGAANPAD